MFISVLNILTSGRDADANEVDGSDGVMVIPRRLERPDSELRVSGVVGEVRLTCFRVGGGRGGGGSGNASRKRSGNR